MAEYDENRSAPTEFEKRPPRRGTDPVTLVVGVGALIASAYVLTDGTGWPHFDPRWLIAGIALVIGLLLLGASMRRRG
jgi:hypothetical protein